MFVKKGLLFAVALMLVFAGKALAGPNASAVASLDIVPSGATGNAVDDGVTSATVAANPLTAAGDSTEIVVELFAKPLTAPIIGGQVYFNLDTTVVKVNAISAGGALFPFGTDAVSANLGGVPGFAELSAANVTNGYLGAVTLVTMIDITNVEFTVGLEFLSVIGDGGSADTLRTPVTLSFNSKPKATVSAPLVTIPRGGVSPAVTVTASGFPAGATITFDVVPSGSANVTPNDDGNGTLTLTATGTGSATVTVTATDGTTTTDAVTISFDEQVPVELASFVGEVVENQVVLNWATASQTNNAGFRVLRSTDQGTFEAVSELIDGAGTSDALMNYSFTDETLPSAEQVFYVLEQIDLDGTIHRSNPIEVTLGARFLNLPTEFASAVYPNPFNPSTTVSYDLPADAQVSIVIYDALGQEIRQLVNNAHSIGRYSVQWDARDNLGRSVGSGVYIAKIKAGQFSATQKMLLLK
jgi:VCBS repeat-containing protein